MYACICIHVCLVGGVVFLEHTYPYILHNRWGSFLFLDARFTPGVLGFKAHILKSPLSSGFILDMCGGTDFRAFTCLFCYACKSLLLCM